MIQSPTPSEADSGLGRILTADHGHESVSAGKLKLELAGDAGSRLPRKKQMFLAAVVALKLAALAVAGRAAVKLGAVVSAHIVMMCQHSLAICEFMPANCFCSS